MRMKLRSIAALAAILTVAPLAITTAHATGDSVRGHEQEQDHDHHVSLAALRRATAKYHSLDATLASGRVDLHLCFDMMGEHFADPRTFSDGILDPLNPEAMVYAHDGNRLKLVAVEWVSSTPGSVMGIPLHLNPALGVYVLHAWIWSHNPDGMFADMNPRIGNCP